SHSYRLSEFWQRGQNQPPRQAAARHVAPATNLMPIPQLLDLLMYQLSLRAAQSYSFPIFV
ncbi:hypothetical protein, partial [Mycobacteroides chelonae]|uniref:hypothetical protein n=1 Tax=Mycobacteroides chelonae TaxID=1774 RepID=UPI001A9775BF